MRARPAVSRSCTALRGLLVSGLVVLMPGCAAGDRADAHALAPEDVIGRYGVGGGLLYLELEPGGRYEGFVLNGMVDGCLNVRGAGTSSGTWALREGAVVFSPVNEPADLVLSLAGATAVPSERGLVVTIQGEDRLLPREEAAFLEDAEDPQPER